MADPTTVVVRTGVANLASVVAGLRRAGLEARITDRPADVASAERAVLPGVGSFGAAMQKLRAGRLVEPLVQRIGAGRPTLAVCLGLQLLGTGSAESPEVEGLGVFDVRAERYSGDVRVPQMGWNLVRPESGCAALETGYAYFANSCRLSACPAGWRAAWSEHGGPFIAALERGAVLACQFHPELSGEWGEALLRRWAVCSSREATAC